MGDINRKEENSLTKGIYLASNSLNLWEYLYNVFVFYNKCFLSLRAHLSTTLLVVISSEIAICCPKSDPMPQIHCYVSLLHTE